MLEVRQLLPSNAEALAQLQSAFIGETVHPIEAAARLAASKTIEHPFIAEIDGQAVGFASLRLVPYLGEEAPYAELTELFIMPDFRRKGVAQALIEAVAALAQKRGATSLIVMTGHDNEAAIAAYRRAGFGNYSLALRKRL
jgi:ribosomal protein S18 acetylase RimI-like enzyme